uniref:Polycomb group RING finger protein 3-like protein n=1 Tax=Dugesia japonica TaxID=6161 RepID=A0A5J6BTG1_DUGJA|nr:polycomb group RING finger protein 3-like protein [Dugesia japonica]
MKKIKVSSLNKFITCFICKGYLIDAVSVTECLHTFCKSCIVKYLEDNNDCPQCKIVIHLSHPENCISIDRTMQEIVYKLVPNLKECERKRREEYYRSISMEIPSNEDLTRFKSEDDPTPDYDTANSAHSQDPNYHRDDDQVNVRLDPGGNELPALPRRFLRLSAMATVTHLRKYVAKKVFNDVSRFREVDIYFNKADNPVILGKDHSLKFVNVLHWRDNSPMPLLYSSPVKVT